VKDPPVLPHWQSAPVVPLYAPIIGTAPIICDSFFRALGIEEVVSAPNLPDLDDLVSIADAETAID
jgi:hypothetical protein